MEYEKLNKNALKCMYVVAMITFVITGAILATVGMLLKNKVIGSGDIAQIISNILLLLIPVELVIELIVPRVRYERYRYFLNDEEINVCEGILVVTSTIVPIERLHKLEVSAGPIDRMFGLAKVQVTTAGGDVCIRFLENEKADFIADTLKKKINEVALEEKKEKADGAK